MGRGGGPQAGTARLPSQGSAPDSVSGLSVIIWRGCCGLLGGGMPLHVKASPLGAGLGGQVETTHPEPPSGLKVADPSFCSSHRQAPAPQSAPSLLAPQGPPGRQPPAPVWLSGHEWEHPESSLGFTGRGRDMGDSSLRPPCAVASPPRSAPAPGERGWGRGSHLYRRRPRSRALIFPHSPFSKASFAAATALSTSLTWARDTWQRTCRGAEP